MSRIQTRDGVFLPALIILRRRVNSGVDRIISGRTWQLKVVLVVIAISLLRAFPDQRQLRNPSTIQLWRATLIKVDDPLADMARFYPPVSHESKLTFRLTVPLLAHVLHLRRTGISVILALSNIVLLGAILSVAYRITGNRRSAFYLCLATACVWAGVSGFQDLRGGIYDSLALCLLLLALGTTSPVLAGIYSFTAAWTDERALIALPTVILFATITSSQQGIVRRVFRGIPVALVIGAMAYAASRVYLTVAHSLLVGTGGVGTEVLTAFSNSDPMAIFTALSGCWLVIALSLMVLLAEKRYGMVMAFCASLGLTVVAALSVADRTRSLAYCLPSIFVGMKVLRESETSDDVECLTMICCLISVIVPLYYFQAWYYWIPWPLPFDVFVWAVHHVRRS